MKSKFNEVATNIDIAAGWVINKLSYTDADPVVLLDCQGPHGQKASVHIDLDRAEFKDSFPQPFTRNPVGQLASKIRAVIAAPKP